MAAKISQYVRSLLQENGYSQINLATNDITNVAMHYTDLKAKPDMFTFNNGSRKKLVCLSGTIPVRYKGSSYNIPIAIWIMENHPQTAPFCFVKPTSTMNVRQGRHVDANGRIFLPYLNEWRQGVHELTSLVQVMTILFGEEPPVVSKPANAAPPSHPPPYPAANPPYPAPGGGYPPQGPPTSSYQPSQPPYPMAQMQTPYPYMPPGYPPMNQAQPTLPYPGSQGTPPVHNTASIISDDMIKASLKSAVNDKLRRRMRDAHAQAESELLTLKQTEGELKKGQSKLNDMIRKLESETAQVDKNIEILETKNKEIEEKISSLNGKQEEMNIDEVVCPTTPLYKQIVECFAEEQALEDTIYYLGEGLRKGCVDLDVFLKHVRSLARQQFVLRATIKKARTTAGLPDIY